MTEQEAYKIIEWFCYKVSGWVGTDMVEYEENFKLMTALEVLKKSIIKEEVQRSLKESMHSVEDVYHELRGFCGDDYHEMPVDQVAQEIGMDVEELKAMISHEGENKNA